MPPENEQEPIVDGIADVPAPEAAPGDQEARAKAAIESDPGTGGAGGKDAKSIAEALSEGIEASAQHGQKKTDKPAGEGDGEDGERPGDDKKQDGDKDVPAEDGDKDKDKKEPDHVNDPIDERLSERAQDRIRSLVGFVKERDEALTTQGKLIDAIQSTGATPEMFAEMVGFMRNANSDEPAALEAAYKTLQNGMRTLAIRMGKPVPEVDLLADYPELAQAVKYGQITEQHAQELAIARERVKVEGTQRTRASDATKATNDAKTEKDTAISDLNALGAHLAKTDKDYQAKFDLITGPLKAAFANIRPSLWKATFEASYAAAVVPKPVVPAAGAAAAAPKKGQPIRPTQPAGGGGKKAPGSMLDAISSAIEGV